MFDLPRELGPKELDEMFRNNPDVLKKRIAELEAQVAKLQRAYTDAQSEADSESGAQPTMTSFPEERLAGAEYLATTKFNVDEMATTILALVDKHRQLTARMAVLQTENAKLKEDVGTAHDYMDKLAAESQLLTAERGNWMEHYQSLKAKVQALVKHWRSQSESLGEGASPTAERLHCARELELLFKEVKMDKRTMVEEQKSDELAALRKAIGETAKDESAGGAKIQLSDGERRGLLESYRGLEQDYFAKDRELKALKEKIDEAARLDDLGNFVLTEAVRERNQLRVELKESDARTAKQREELKEKVQLLVGERDDLALRLKAAQQALCEIANSGALAKDWHMSAEATQAINIARQAVLKDAKTGAPVVVDLDLAN